MRPKTIDIVAGHPYGAMVAIEEVVLDGITDAWALIRPSFTASSELYELNVESEWLTVKHHASTANATLLHLTIHNDKLLLVASEEDLVEQIVSHISSIIMTLNGIENAEWSDI